MTLHLGQRAPDFEQDSTAGRIRFYDWLGSSWGLFFSHPKNFTPVCTTELGEVARLKLDLDRRGVKALGLSVDSVRDHLRWDLDIEETQGHALNFPLLADPGRRIANLYGMIHPEADPSLTIRTVFVISPDKKIRLMLAYPPSTGRNFTEILRAIDSLQLTDRKAVATPVNWNVGEPAIISPGLADDEARARFPQGWRELTPYLRIVDLTD
jgi:alkyl hydroperoxide reductase subunit AhpC